MAAAGHDVAAIVAAIAAQRVGGSFWSEDDAWAMFARGGPVVARPDDERALLAAAAGVAVHDAAGATIARDALRARLAARVLAVDYADPFSGAPVTPLDWIAQLGAWRRVIEDNRAIGAVHGIAPWKRAAIARFLWSGARDRGTAQAIWPSRVAPDRAERIATRGPLVRLEDGFLRSAGLGARLHQPHSIVVDRRGVHFDPHAPSDLEHLLAHTAFDDAMRARAARLARRIVAAGVTKYGTGGGAVPDLPCGRRIVLVAGQVEDDASVRAGGAGVAGNLDLLRRARAAEPDAFLIYRPHPDVAAGLRRGDVPARAAARLADAVLPRAALPALLARVDAVHVLTSLTGFEALLRGCAVVVHGQPFYAGWGLTRDLAPAIPRRGRALALEELVAGALILYPRYLDPVTRLPCPPEVLVARLAARTGAGWGPLQYLRAAQGLATRGARRLAGA
jgi:capsular polysaccharide export protein